jgi:hypothetical protein
MKSTKITQNISYALLGLFTVYGIFSIPFAFFLMAMAVGLITYGFGQTLEITTAVTLITGALIVLINRYNKPKEGFMNGDNALEIAKRVREITRPQPRQPIGVYASGYVEGFEDVTEPTAPKDVEEKKPESAISKPAPVAPPATTAGFKDVKEPEGLFKLGVLPSESKTGPHIDQGTTVLNALNALNPDQVKRMSEDTQKLIDTQKSLMSMLGTMKPMLSDGKQLIDTFQTMFGPVPQAAEALKVN